jgi:hypothetical protein
VGKTMATMKLRVRNISGRIIEVEVSPTETVYVLRERLSEQIGIHSSQIRLVYRGIPLRINETLAAQNVTELGGLIQAAVVLQGGEGEIDL